MRPLPPLGRSKPPIGLLGLGIALLITVLYWAGTSWAADAPATGPTTAPATAPSEAGAGAGTVTPPETPPPPTVKPWQGDYDTGSIAWMLTSSALVLLMVPGLALFYGGMVRAKNVLNMFLMCMVCIGVMGLIWVIYGYAVAFPVVDATTSLISTGATAPPEGSKADPALISWLAFDPKLLFLNKFNSNWGSMLTSGDTFGAIETGIPEIVFVAFQGKFFIITPALIVGAVAERVRFGPIILFMIIWSTVVYLPVAHWVWNVNGWLFQRGVFDFAGGTVVHVLAGVSALAVCLVVGPRYGHGKVPMPPHSLGLTLIGAGLLWFGWFGFNAGSAVALPGSDLPIAGRIAGMAFINTQVAAAAAATAWMLVEWVHGGKPTILGFASGMVAGLVIITPCAGHVVPWQSIVIGVIGGGACYFACRIKNVLKYDDSLDAFGVHGIGGALGALLVGVFAVRPFVDNALPGGSAQFGKQLLGLTVTAVFAFVLSFAIAKAIAVTIGLRAKADDEMEGMDIAAHGERGYHLSDSGFEGSILSSEAVSDARGGTAVTAR